MVHHYLGYRQGFENPLKSYPTKKLRVMTGRYILKVTLAHFYSDDLVTRQAGTADVAGKRGMYAAEMVRIGSCDLSRPAGGYGDVLSFHNISNCYCRNCSSTQVPPCGIQHTV